MADKRYIAVFDAVDKTSAKLLRIEKATKNADDAVKKYQRANERAERAQDRLARSTVDQTTKFDRMTRAASAAGRSVVAFGDQGTRSMKNFGGLLTGITRDLFSLPAMIAGAGAAFGAWKLTDFVLGGALRQEMTLTQLQGLAGSDQLGNGIYSMLREEAANSTFSSQDYTQATRSYLGFSKEEGQLKEMLDVTKRLALLDPVQGFDGASFALKEAMSGDLLSLSERFEIPKSFLRGNGFDSGGDYLTNLTAVEKTLEQMGMGDSAVKKFESTGMAQLTEFKNKSLDWLGQWGRQSVEEVKPFFEDVNGFFNSPSADRFADTVSVKLGSTLDAITNGLGTISWSDVELGLTNSGQLLRELGDSGLVFIDAMSGGKGGTPAEVLNAFAESIGNAADDVHEFNESMRSMFSWMEDSGLNSFMNNSLETGQKLVSPYDMLAPEGKKFKGMLPWMFDAFQGEFSPYKTDKNYKPGDKSFIQFDWNAGSSSRIDGSHATGLKRVPFDGYIAELHRDEEIVPASEARKQGGRGGDVLISNNTFHVRSESDIHAIGQEIVQQLKLRGAF